MVSADGLIAVTPIFFTRSPGLFTSFIDMLDPGAGADPFGPAGNLAEGGPFEDLLGGRAEG